MTLDDLYLYELRAKSHAHGDQDCAYCERCGDYLPRPELLRGEMEGHPALLCRDCDEALAYGHDD